MMTDLFDVEEGAGPHINQHLIHVLSVYKEF